MQFSSALLSQFTLLGGWLLMALLWLVALRRAPWRSMLAVPLRQHALFAALVVLCLIWSFRFEVVPGFGCHPILVSTLTLVFGWCFALLIGSLAGVIVALCGNADIAALPWDWLLTVALPASLGFMLMRWHYRLPVRNLFFYILGLGFFGAIASAAITCAGTGLLLWLTQSPAFVEQLWDKVAVVVPLLYAEGFLNGVIITAITVFVPDLVKTFDDNHFRD